MSSWTPEELHRFAVADDMHVAPLREDGVTPGTPTFIWSVVVDGDLYVRPYHGARSRWFRAASAQGAGRIRLDGAEREVEFSAAAPGVLDAVDAEYRRKYAGSPYVTPMVADGPRSSTVRIVPRGPVPA